MVAGIICRTWQALQGNARSLSHSCHDGGNHHTAAHQTPTNCLHEDVLNLVSHLSLPKKFAATQPLATVADVADHAVFAEESGWLAKENAGERMAPPPADASEESDAQSMNGITRSASTGGSPVVFVAQA